MQCVAAKLNVRKWINSDIVKPVIELSIDSLQLYHNLLVSLRRCSAFATATKFSVWRRAFGLTK
jgi:hypothetical protein